MNRRPGPLPRPPRDVWTTPHVGLANRPARDARRPRVAEARAYVFYCKLLFVIAYASASRYVYERASRLVLRAAGYRRRTALVGSWHQIEAVAHALANSPYTGVTVVGFVSLKPRPDNGLKSLGKLKDMDTVITEHRIEEVVIADSDFPQR